LIILMSTNLLKAEISMKQEEMKSHLDLISSIEDIRASVNP